jgi:methyltransferase (TIGR00027 family)
MTAVAGGATQAVILGAGFDTRAYRLSDFLKDVRVFEVDQPATQQLKIRRVREATGAPPANLVYAPFDFRKDTLGDVLARAGFRLGERSFFIWEGVTMYLPKEAVHATLSWIGSNAAPGSSVVFDYAYEAAVNFIAKFDTVVDLNNLPEAAKRAVERFRRLLAGEPWIFGVPDRTEKEFVESFGLHLHEVLGLTGLDAVAKYLTRADGSIFGSLPAMDQQHYLILKAVR